DSRDRSSCRRRCRGSRSSGARFPKASTSRWTEGSTQATSGRCATPAPTCSSPGAQSSGRTILEPPTGRLRARSRPMARRRYERPPNHVIVLYGATGDLAKRKILPGLFHLSSVGLLPRGYRIVGVSRGTLSDEEMRSTASLALQLFGRKPMPKTQRENFLHRVYGSNHDDVAGAVAR